MIELISYCAIKLGELAIISVFFILAVIMIVLLIGFLYLFFSLIFKKE